MKRIESVYRLSMLGMTGALRSTPTAALYALLHLLPADLSAKNLASKTAARLHATGQFVCRPSGHSSIASTLLGRTDYVTPDLHFETTFDATIEVEGWRKGMRSADSVNVYTDGSKMERGVGAAVVCSELDLFKSFKLPNHCSIFQAEIFAIRKAAELLISNTVNKQINLYIDSQAAIKALLSHSTSSRSVTECRTALVSLAPGSIVHLYWVPGHIGVAGNEEADRLAKEGALSGTMPVEDVPISLQAIKRELDLGMIRKAQKVWSKTQGCKVSRIMCPSYDTKLTRFLLSLKKEDARLLVGVLTGHCLLASHAFKLALTFNKICRRCKEKEETVEHILCECPALSVLRASLMGSGFLPNLDSAAKMGHNKVFQFAKRTAMFFNTAPGDQ